MYEIKIETIQEHFNSGFDWFVHMTCKDSRSAIFSVLVAQVTSDKWLLYNFTMWYFGVNIHSKPARFCRSFLLWSVSSTVTSSLSASPSWTVLAFFFKFVRHALDFSCLSSCRTQKMGFSWTWMSRCPWCAVSWLRTQSWREDTMLWASPRGHNFCM